MTKKSFTVTIVNNITEYATIDVEAENEHEAQNLIYEQMLDQKEFKRVFDYNQYDVVNDGYEVINCEITEDLENE